MAALTQLLSDLGLEEKEILVFLALVKLGISPVSAIGKESNITRTHMYDILAGLQEKGLVTEGKRGGAKAYEAIDHVGVLALLSRKQKELKRLEKQFVEAAGAFHALQVGGQQKTQVRFFDGPQGIHAIYAEIRNDLKKLQDPFEVLTIFSPGQIERVLPGWFEDEEYIDLGALMTKRAIVYPSPMLEEYKKKIAAESKSTHAYRLWPQGEKDFSTDTICWQNKMTYIDLVDHPSGIIIESAAIVASFRMWFEMLWKTLPAS